MESVVSDHPPTAAALLLRRSPRGEARLALLRVRQSLRHVCSLRQLALGNCRNLHPVCQFGVIEENFLTDPAVICDRI